MWLGWVGWLRELALQCAEVLDKAVEGIGLKTTCVYGGMPKYEQKQALRKGEASGRGGSERTGSDPRPGERRRRSPYQKGREQTKELSGAEEAQS